MKLNGNQFARLERHFFQIEIYDEHREITTNTTPKGLFRLKRLPFGIKTASSIFQQATDGSLAGLEGVYTYIDDADIVVMGSNQEEHDQGLHKTLQRLQEKGWNLKREKCSFGLEEDKYLGLVVNARKISADPQAIRATANMPTPSTVSEVQSFLGMAKHYGKFIPDLHQLKRALEELPRKNRPWTWDHQHQAAFK